MTQILQIITEYGYVFKNVEQNHFIFTIDPLNQEIINTGWQGKFAMIIKAYERGNIRLQKLLDVKIKKLTKNTRENKLSIRRLEQGVDKEFKDLRNRIKDYEIKIGQLRQRDNNNENQSSNTTISNAFRNFIKEEVDGLSKEVSAEI